MSRRKPVLVCALALPLSLLAACSGGTKAPANATPATVAPAASTEASTPAGTRPGTTTLADIHVADAIALPEGVDGRLWWPVAARGDELLLDAERRVYPAPGEPVEQGASSYDQRFVWWNPKTGAFRDAWTNTSRDFQGIVAFDDSRAVVQSAHLNGMNWTLSIRDFTTNAVTTVAQASSINDMMSRVFLTGNRLLLDHVIYENSQYTATMDLFDLAAGSRTVVAGPITWTAGVQTSWALASGSMALDRVAWVEQSSATALPQLVVLNLASGTREVVATPWPVGSCYLLNDARRAVCAERPAADQFGTVRDPWRKAIIDLSTGQAHEFANDFTGLVSPVGTQSELDDLGARGSRRILRPRH